MVPPENQTFIPSENPCAIGLYRPLYCYTDACYASQPVSIVQGALLKSGDVNSDFCFPQASVTAAGERGRIRPECGKRRGSFARREMRGDRVPALSSGSIFYRIMQFI